jgi:hypothetical protein
LLFSTAAAVAEERPACLMSGIAALPPTSGSAMTADLVELAAAVAPFAGNGGLVYAAAVAQATAANLQLPKPLAYPMLTSSQLPAGTVVCVAINALASAMALVPGIEVLRHAMVHQETNPQPIVSEDGTVAKPGAIGAFGKLMPPQQLSLAFGAGTAAGSFGQFLFSPLAVALIDRVGWQDTLVIFAAVVLLIMPLSLALASPRQPGAPVAASNQPQQSVAQALSEALGHRSYVLLVLGFFTCGFQIFFIAVHPPAYLVDRGLPAENHIGASR